MLNPATFDPAVCPDSPGPGGGKAGYLSRQPILDRRGVVFGYELIFRESQNRQADPLGSSRHGLLDALAIFGAERFTGSARAFLQCSPESLVEDAWDGLSSTHTVLQIPAISEPSERLVRSCRTLREAGFQIALSHFEPEHVRPELLRLADFVKVEAEALETPAWNRVCSRLASTRAVVIADRVHTHEAYCKARALGLKYFEGFYFCNPELIPSGHIPANRAQQFRMLRELFKDPLDLNALCPLVMGDPSVVYRLLRFANSPLCALREPVTSVQAAIMILGDNLFRRIATLAIQCALSQDQTPELLNMALLRARFCHAAAELCGLDGEEQYLIGMLSLLPPMLRVPMRSILPELPLRAEVREALAGSPVPERILLSWVEHLEENNVPGCEEIADTFGLDRERLVDEYWRALSEQPALGD
ncbi:HDOD domain-containing protein [Acidobacteria bacterium AB60]|nr:HDOD domain-containing protein [Acidobacteria bacterium AB60]